MSLSSSFSTYFTDNSSKARVDFDRLWYTNVGVNISTTMIVMIFNPHVIDYILGNLTNCIKSIKAKYQFL